MSMETTSVDRATVPKATSSEVPVSEQFSDYYKGMCHANTCNYVAQMETWEREKEACSSGKMAEGCGYGCLYRVQVLGEGAYEIPLGFALTTLTGLSSLFAGACSVLWCVDLVVCCPLYTLCLPDSCNKTMDKVTTCGMGCLMCGFVSASTCCLTAEKSVMCFPNLIAEEALNGWCHQPQYMLWKSRKVSELNEKAEDVFDRR